MQGENGKFLNSKVKIKIFVNEENIQPIASDIENMINQYLIEKCGAGNFEFETDVQY